MIERLPGGPPRASSLALRRLLAGEHPDAVSPTWPAVGRLVSDGERMLREVTFVADADAEDHDVMIHINGITDSHRTDVGPAILDVVPSSRSRRTIAYLLPDDLTASYRFVSLPGIPIDAGRTRPGWLRIHEAGRPDPRNPARLTNPLGSISSVLICPAAHQHDVWTDEAAALDPVSTEELTQADGSTLTLLRPSSPHGVLVLFDGEWWRRIGIAAALSRYQGRQRTVVLVPSGTQEERSRLLPHPEQIIARLEKTVLPAIAAVTGVAPDPSTTVVAGQSYGGLAAASIVALRPDLALTAIVQSGSFHFRAGQTARAPEGQTGDLVSALAGAHVSGRFLVQAGTEESGMGDLADAFSTAAVLAGAQVSQRRYSGGHDYAWWRTGLFDALDECDATETIRSAASGAGVSSRSVVPWPPDVDGSTRGWPSSLGDGALRGPDRP